MKRYFAILFFAFAFVAAHAQQNDSLLINQSTSGNGPNVIHSHGVVTDGFNYWEDKFTGHWSGIYIGVNGFLNEDYSIYLPEDAGFMDADLLRSTVLNLNLLQFSRGFQHNKNTIGLVTGIGLEIQTYFLDKNTNIEKGSTRIHPVELFYDSNQKSKLSSVYLSIPLLVEFQVPVKTYGNRFYVSAGLVVNKRLTTHSKVKYRKNNKKEKLKTPDNFYMHDFRFSGMIRVGYRWINLFATYDIQPLFQDGKGPELYPFSVGIALFSF